MKISIIIPVYNEEKNLIELYEKIMFSVHALGCDYEIIAVNDGSRDKSLDVLKELSCKDKNFKIINFLCNFGQTTALSAGIDKSTGGVLVFLDSDMENDPGDIPRLLAKINEGYDLVSGWRQDRWSKKKFTRKIPSVAANWLISKITKVNLHDYGCTLKAYRREIIENVQLYGEMHRFIPVYSSIQGAKITEIVVNYQPRKYGKSNYDMSRVMKVLWDLITVLFLSRYFNRPMHFFGKFGFWSLVLSFLSGIFAIFLKFFKGVSFISTPLPLLTVLLIIIAIQFILMGLLAEILIRIYYRSNNGMSYVIKEEINFN